MSDILSKIGEKGIDALIVLAARAAREGFAWAIDKIRGEAKQHGLDLDDHALEDLMNAQFGVLVTAMLAMKTSIDHDVARLEDAERRFRESSNVTVVSSMDEPWPDEPEPESP